jgi:hypothetical protein
MHPGLEAAYSIQLGQASAVEKKLPSPDGRTLASARVHWGAPFSFGHYGDCRVELKDLSTGATKTLISNPSMVGDAIFAVTVAPVCWVLTEPFVLMMGG